jgi:hypothetical protein
MAAGVRAREPSASALLRLPGLNQPLIQHSLGH